MRERLDAHVIPQLVAGLNELAVVQSIATVLATERDPEAQAVSREIDLMITKARRSFGLRGDLEAARRFLNDLAEDAAAQVPDPGPPTVEPLDPGIPRAGVMDGTKFLNLARQDVEMATPSS